MKSDLDKLMHENQIDALLICGAAQHNPAMTYFTGIAHVTQAELIKVINQEPILYYASMMEREEAAQSGLKSVSYDDLKIQSLLEQYKGKPIQARALRYQRMLEENGITQGRIVVYGLVDAGSAYATFRELNRLMPDLEIQSEEENSLLLRAMATKDKNELDRIRNMGKITTEVVGLVADYLTTQKVKNNLLMKSDDSPLLIGDMKKKINLWLAERGAENPEGTVFAQGRDSGIPHSSGLDSMPIELGKTIVFDIFPCEMYGGYYYDFTRTWCLGFASDEVLKAYQDVLDVYLFVTKQLKVGQSCPQYQKITCDFFESRGHPTIQTNPSTESGYVHSLGHGVGLHIHERPWFGRNADANDTLQVGSVFTIEPGLYYPEKGFGIRIEDTYLVSETGAIDIIAPYPFDLVLPIRGQ
ncbi:MAG: M24 family metallopeptidase [Anaerolineales bacterium]